MFQTRSCHVIVVQRIVENVFYSIADNQLSTNVTRTNSFFVVKLVTALVPFVTLMNFYCYSIVTSTLTVRKGAIVFIILQCTFLIYLTAAICPIGTLAVVVVSWTILSSFKAIRPLITPSTVGVFDARRTRRMLVPSVTL